MSEAAAVTVVYVLVVELLIYREVPLNRLAAIVRDSMVLVGGILLILGISLASTNYMIDAQVPQQLIELVTRYVSSQTSFLLLLICFLLLIGCILHIFSALVLVVPLMLPVAAQYGVDPVHLGHHLRGHDGTGLSPAADRPQPVHLQLPLQPARSWTSALPRCRSYLSSSAPCC